MYDRDFTPANNPSTRCHPKSHSHRPPNQCDCMFGKPFRPELDVARQGRVDCCGRMPGVHPNPRNRPQGPEDWSQDPRSPTQDLWWSRPSLSSLVCFPRICSFTMRGNKEGSCFEQSPEQRQARSSPSSSVELKFELNTQLTVSCVVAVALAYGLVTVLIALDSILLGFGNTIILLLTLFVWFGWRGLLGEFGKKRSAAK